MDATNCLAGHSTVSFKNHAIEHPGKGMKQTNSHQMLLSVAR